MQASRLVRIALIPGAVAMASLVAGCGTTHVTSTPTLSVPAAGAAGIGNTPARPGASTAPAGTGAEQAAASGPSAGSSGSAGSAAGAPAANGPGASVAAAGTTAESSTSADSDLAAAQQQLTQLDASLNLINGDMTTADQDIANGG